VHKGVPNSSALARALRSMPAPARSDEQNRDAIVAKITFSAILMRNSSADRHETPGPAEALRWYELRLFNLYRMLVALVFALLLLTHLGTRYFDLGGPVLAAGRVGVIIYALAAGGLFAISESRRWGVTLLTLIGVGCDLVMGGMLLFVFGGLSSGVGVLLLITVAMAALLLPGRLALLAAAIATCTLLSESMYSLSVARATDRNLAQAALLGTAFFLTVAIFYWLARLTRESQELAERQGVDIANLGQINELIIQRMRTGILVLDGTGQVRRFNESGWYLLGTPPGTDTEVRKLSPDLYDRWRYWLTTGKHNNVPIQIAQGVPAVVPRFTRLGGEDDAATLCFLEDESMVYRRAEELTLASLGRLSASIAHEVRNPLGAISHAAQLLAESEEMPEADKRLIEIIMNHCARVNGIVENVLQLSRRERSRPECVSLASWAYGMVNDFKQAQSMGQDQLRLLVDQREARALVDPSQLTQAVWNLLRNAIRYGRQPDQPADITLRIRQPNPTQGALVEIIDRGPGIPLPNQRQLFEPFFTTRADGTGLGLYICKQLLGANQGSIEYVNVPGGGSCFRIQLAVPQRDLA
jgi:two-component system, NtrC family, sensor histidine kinase PilS